MVAALSIEVRKQCTSTSSIELQRKKENNTPRAAKKNAAWQRHSAAIELLFRSFGLHFI